MAEQNPDPTRGITTKWGDATKLPLLFGDFMHWRSAGDRFYITIGQTVFPLEDGAVPNGTVLPVEPVVRIALTHQTVRIWADLLQKAVAALPDSGSKNP